MAGAATLGAQTMAPAADAPGGLKFEDVTDQTGLPQIMKAWKDELCLGSEGASTASDSGGYVNARAAGERRPL